MRRTTVILATLAVSSVAFAQQAQSPLEQALGFKLMAEINAGLQCNSELVTLKQAVAKAEARVKELEAKLKDGADAKQ